MDAHKPPKYFSRLFPPSRRKNEKAASGIMKYIGASHRVEKWPVCKMKMTTIGSNNPYKATHRINRTLASNVFRFFERKGKKNIMNNRKKPAICIYGDAKTDRTLMD
jgi:hypothetical protein